MSARVQRQTLLPKSYRILDLGLRLEGLLKRKPPVA